LFPKGVRPQGNTLILTLVAISATACLGLAGWRLFGRRSDVNSPELLTTTVWKGPYDFAVVTRGSVESGSSSELCCEVRSRGGGTAILDVVPEGTIVKEGDTVVELDSSNLLLELDQQKIVISTRESLLAQAQSTLKAAEIAKSEYLEGLYIAQEKQLLSELYVAERAKATSEAALESTKVLYEKAIVAAAQLQAAYANLDDAINKLDGAQTNLVTLRNLTKQKELTLLEAGIASAEAHLKMQQRNLKLEQQRLKNIENQIARCTIKATATGQVVYVNEPDIFRSSSQSPFIVAPGAMVRERQVIIWLPNAADMQVKVTVNEARITLIRPGMPVSIRVDAFDDEMMEGEVTKVGQYAEPSGFWGGSINKYATTIKIKNPSLDLRVGMNAEAWIHVEQMPDALQLPVQALAESQGHFFSLVKNGDSYETREVEIGSTNDQVATIERGLEEGDEVVINPRSAGRLLRLPDLPDSTPIAMDEIERIDPRKTAVRMVTESGGNGRDDGKDVFDTTPADMVARYLENDTNQDDMLSQGEIAKLDTRLQQRLVSADANGDGLLERRELELVAANAMQHLREKDHGSTGVGVRRHGERNEREPRS
jgi:multidrug efflux pump subunit AcrA (membrane-fusion protein)